MLEEANHIIIPKILREVKALLAAYLLFAIYMTMVGERMGEPGIKLELFWSYREFFTNAYMRQQIINNIWFFVPIGAMVYRLWPKMQAVLIPVLLSLSIELLQYLLNTGQFELDDIINNTLGGLIGMILCMVILRFTKGRLLNRSVIEK